MIITKTPYRISFVGGGTDLKSFYAEEAGQVLSVSINKYIYIVVKRQIGIVEYKYRVNWSKVEFKNSVDDIEHPIVREALKLLSIDFPIEITTFADIPAQTGLGSSSAFAVGLVHALYALKCQMVTKHEIANLAAHIEIDLLGRTIGKQDHYASAYGNLNVLTFHSNEEVTVEPVICNREIRRELESNLLLFYTRLKRDASEILESQNDSVIKTRDILQKMRDLVPELRQVLNAESDKSDISKFGRILHQNWMLKRSITNDISNPQIDEYYEKAKAAGAEGGKLLGAGGGGFLLFYVEPKFRQKVIDALNDLYHMAVEFDSDGTRITYYDQDNVI